MLHLVGQPLLELLALLRRLALGALEPRAARRLELLELLVVPRLLARLLVLLLALLLALLVLVAPLSHGEVGLVLCPRGRHLEPPRKQQAELALAEHAQVLAAVQHLRLGLRLLPPERALLAVVPPQRVRLAEVLDRRAAQHKLLDAHVASQQRTRVVVALGLGLLPLLLLQHIRRRLLLLDHREDVLRVEELWVDGRILEAAAHHKDLRRLITRRLRLRRLDLVEELVEDPDQRVVVVGPEDLGHKPPARLQEVGGEPQRVQGQLVLAVRVLQPRRAHVGCAVVDHHVHDGALELALQSRPALLRRDVLLQRRALGHRLDRRQINADADGVLWHVLPRDLHPRPGRRAQVQDALGLGEELVLLVQLQQLERRTRAVAAILGEVVELVETLLGNLVLLWHPRPLCALSVGIFSQRCRRPR